MRMVVEMNSRAAKELMNEGVGYGMAYHCAYRLVGKCSILSGLTTKDKPSVCRCENR
jgi:hypothetical protein